MLTPPTDLPIGTEEILLEGLGHRRPGYGRHDRGTEPSPRPVGTSGPGTPGRCPGPDLSYRYQIQRRRVSTRRRTPYPVAPFVVMPLLVSV